MLVKKHDFIIIICTLFCGLGVLFINDPTVCLAIALIQTIMIFKKAKISLFSILAFLLNFCLIQEYGAYVGWDVYGLLAFKQVPIYFYEMFICVFSFNLILYCVLSISNCLENEGKLFTLNVDAGFQISVLLIIAAVGITFLMFPTIPSLGTFVLTNRFTRGILPFTGWSCMPPFFMAIAIMNERCRKCAIFVTVIIVFWYVFHGERVDCMGLLAFLAIKYYNNNRNNKNTIMKIGVIAGCVVVLFVAVGMLRTGADNLQLKKVLKGALIQSTACDVSYVFNCAVDLATKGELFHGITFLSYAVNCVPFLNAPYSFGSYIQNFYPTAGGGLFFAEPIANFGLKFAIFFSGAYILLLARLVRKTTKYRFMVYAALCITIFRTAWYGLNYPIIAILYFAPAILFATRLINRKKLGGYNIDEVSN